MTSPKLAFASAIALVAAVVSAPARAITICTTPLTVADGPAQESQPCQTPATLALYGAETWSNFFNGGSGATYTKLQGFFLSAEPFQLDSFVFCQDGRSYSRVVTNVQDDIVPCPARVLGVFGQGEIALNP